MMDKRKTGLLWGVSTLLLAPSAFAQTGSNALDGAEPAGGASVQGDAAAPVDPAEGVAAAAAKKPGNRVIEEIVVTAAKREENVQDVPISIAAFSGEKLDALGVTSAEQLPKITPGLTFSSSAGYTQVFLRGVGNSAFLPSADPNVPVYVDGVAMIPGHGVAGTLGRVARVEVLKGPQGTLFGRNSTGGAISIITPDPKPGFEGDVGVEIGNYDSLNAQVFVNVPITDNFGATFAAYSQSQDPFDVNDAGATVSAYTRGGRVKALWQVTDDFSFNASAMYGEQSNNFGTAGELTRPAPLLSGAGLIIPKDPSLDHHYSENVLSGTVLYTDLFSGGAQWKLPWVDLKTIVSHQEQHNNYVAYDYDGSVMPLISFYSTNEFFKQTTAELQILSNSETPLSQYFSWVAGTYYLESHGGFPDLFLQVAQGNEAAGLLSLLPGLNALNNQLVSVLGIPIAGITGPITADSGGLIKSRSISGYLQGTLHLQDMFDLSQQINLILGARLDREERGLTDNRLAVQNPVTFQTITLLPFSVPTISEVQVPFKVQLQWYPADETQVYAGFSRGFTAPTYSTVNFFKAPPPVKAQKVDSYELGMKSQFFDNALMLNAAAFWINEYNLLTGFASLTSGGVVEFDNAPKARIRGVEADFTWAPLPDLDPGLVLLGSASYLNAIYTDYPNGRGYDPATGLSFGPKNPIPTQQARDFTGNDIDRTPKFSYNIGVNQTLPLGDDSRVELNLATNYSDGYFYDAQNAPEYATPSFQMIDASASYFYDPWGLQLTAFGKNLTQEKYIASSFILDTGRFQTLNPPRTYGLRFKYTF